jgi:hypothetical protein
MSSATYLPQLVPAYRGNPLIEALPPLMGKEEFFAQAMRLPLYEKEVRKAENCVRAHMIADIFDVFVPLPRHYSEQTVFARMIRRGYVARENPADLGYWKKLQQRQERMRKMLKVLSPPGIPLPVRSDGLSTDLVTAKIGMTGCGKTKSADISLSMYPQVIEHGFYNGLAINIRQVVWMKVQAPSQGSVKDFCMQFFRGMDRLLDTNYAAQLHRGSAEQMLDNVIMIAGVHALGLLVTDEAQEFSNIKSGGTESLVGYILRMNNGMGVPQVMIGTYKIGKVLYHHLRNIRRSAGIGMPEWGAFEHSPREWLDDENAVKTEWIIFLRALWSYQYTRRPTVLTEELSDTLFDECQGIPDFAAKVYFLVQDRLIATSDSESPEKITSGLLRSVARDYLQTAREHLRAIRERDIDKLSKLEDVKLPPITEYLQNHGNSGEASCSPNHGESHQEAEGPCSERLDISDTSNEGMPNSQSEPALASIPSVMSDLVSTNQKDPNACYEKVRAAGFIKAGTEFLDLNPSQTRDSSAKLKQVQSWG